MGRWICLIVSLMQMCNSAFAGIIDENIDTTAPSFLREIIVVGKADYFKIKGPNKFVYEVEKDTALQKSTVIEALKNVPILDARPNGEVSAMSGKKLVFKINGLNDPMLSNLPIALTSMPTEVIKRIQFREEIHAEGDNVIEVDIVTKGRLEGYLTQFNSEVSDTRWRNSIWALSKVKKLTFHGSYANSWQWSHRENSQIEEIRITNPKFHKFETYEVDNGYKVDLNNFEGGMTYNIDDNSFLNLFGSAMYKAAPRNLISSTTNIFDSNGRAVLSYDNMNKKKMKDAEYSVSLKYEKSYDNLQKPGKIKFGYEFYSRPYNLDSKNAFGNVNCNTDDDISYLNLIDSRYNLTKTFLTNTLVTELKRNLSRKFMVDVYGKVRIRHESYANEMDLGLEKISGEYGRSKSTLNEFSGFLSPKVQWMSNRYEITAGATMGTYAHAIRATGFESDYTNKRIYVLPFISAAFLTNKDMNVSVSYNMRKQIPDITALDPYRDVTTPGKVYYGNPYLKPQVDHSLKLEFSGKTGRLYSGLYLSGSYISDIILPYRFYNDNVINQTFGNIAERNMIELSVYTSGRLPKGYVIRFNADVDWISYKSSMMSIENHGWQFWAKAHLEKEIPRIVTLNVNASYSTRGILLQGMGPQNFSYSLEAYKVINHRLTLLAEASTFIPIWLKQKSETKGSNYTSIVRNRVFHAAFSFTVRCNLGKLRYQPKRSLLDMDNDDIKINYSE